MVQALPMEPIITKVSNEEGFGDMGLPVIQAIVEVFPTTGELQ